MEKNVVIAIVLGVLLVIAGVQAFTLLGLKNSVQGSAVAAPMSGHSSGGANLPSNLQNLPQMVGGC